MRRFFKDPVVWHVLVLVIVAAGAFLYAQDSSPVPIPSPAPLYRPTDAERLNLARLEAALWQARYAMEIQQRTLVEAIAAVREKCQASGGRLTLDRNPSSMECEKSTEKTPTELSTPVPDLDSK